MWVFIACFFLLSVVSVIYIFYRYRGRMRKVREGMKKRNEMMADRVGIHIMETQRLAESEKELLQKNEGLTTRIKTMTDTMLRDRDELEESKRIKEQAIKERQRMTEENALLRLRGSLGIDNINERIYRRSIVSEKSISGMNRSKKTLRNGADERETFPMANDDVEKYEIGGKWMREWKRNVNKELNNFMVDLNEDMGEMSDLESAVVLYLLAGIDIRGIAYLSRESEQKISKIIFRLRSKIRKLGKEKISRYRVLMTRKDMEILND